MCIRDRSQGDPDHFDVVGDFSGPFPVEVITRMSGVPEEYRQKVREWIDTSLTREPGNIGYTEEGMAAAIESGMYYYKLAQERRANPQDDMISRLIAAEVVPHATERECRGHQRRTGAGGNEPGWCGWPWRRNR